MELKPGNRLVSTVCATEVIVVKAPADAVDVSCGGAAMVDPTDAPAEKGTPAAGSTGTQLGKRYSNADETLELLCTKPGDGSLAADGSPLELQEAKPLPASD